MKKYISKPLRSSAFSGRAVISKKQDAESHFGYYETIGERKTQEDALAWYELSGPDLSPEGAELLAPEEIGYRLWTSYQLLDKKFMSCKLPNGTPANLPDGTTASTTVYDGRGNLITATLADAAAFAAVYGKDGFVLGVVRLNQVTHKPTETEEKNRIKREGGRIRRGRINISTGSLAVSRAIGDRDYKLSGVVPDASIDITSREKILSELGIEHSAVGSIKIVTTCDGFTDGSGWDNQKKGDHEAYLKECLKKVDNNLNEADLAERLARQATDDGSTDNVSIAIQTIPGPGTDHTPFLMGVYDGHGGRWASSYAASRIGKIFKEQCSLGPAAYRCQPLSVHNQAERYSRDNQYITPGHKQIAEKLYEIAVKAKDHDTALRDLDLARYEGYFLNTGQRLAFIDACKQLEIIEQKIDYFKQTKEPLEEFHQAKGVLETMHQQFKEALLNFIAIEPKLRNSNRFRDNIEAAYNKAAPTLVQHRLPSQLASLAKIIRCFLKAVLQVFCIPTDSIKKASKAKSIFFEVAKVPPSTSEVPEGKGPSNKPK